jgi:phage shock protein A
MVPADEDLRGLDPEAARDYIFHFITALRMTEKKLAGEEAAYAKWQNRAALARDKAEPALASEAEAAAGRVKTQIETLEGEITELRGKIEKMRTQLPGLAARERRVDPDLLEQELLIALGRSPGEEGPESAGGTARTEKALAEMDTQSALESLKRRMGLAAADRANDGNAGSSGGDAAR